MIWAEERSVGSKIFQKTLISIFILVCFICLLPFVYIINISLSSAEAIMSGKVQLLPVDLTWEAYKTVLTNPGFLHSLYFSVFLTLIHTAVALTATIAMAYPLSKSELKGRNIISLFVIITMYFHGGMIPDYLLVKQLGLLDKLAVLILPGMIGAYNMIIMRSFFSSIDKAILESAYLDGCSEFKILLKIVLPLSTPVLATIGLFYAVGRWNGITDVLLYVTDSKYHTLQLKLREIIMMEQIAAEEGIDGGGVKVLSESIKSASIILSTIPILVAYPFIQKYFTKGIMLGSVKG